MAVGWVVGKRYSRVQVGSVMALTVGVVVSAWADAVGKVSFVCFSLFALAMLWDYELWWRRNALRADNESTNVGQTQHAHIFLYY